MKKFLDGPVDQVTEGVTQAIAADAFTFAEYDESAGEKVAWSDYSYWGSTFRMFFKNRVAVTLLVLLAAILEQAAGMNTITTHASITARPFFARRGYIVKRKQRVVRKGISLTNYVMVKYPEKESAPQ